MRLNLPAATGLLPLALLGACAAGHAGPVAAPVEGLVYDCRSPEGASAGTARILFNGQGYQPAGRVVTPGGRATPRSTATLWYGNREYALAAGWTYLGMRYRSIAPFEPGRLLVWAADGEDARILSAPEQESGDETEVAICTRRRHVAGAHAREGHQGADDTHHR